jgi:hypothetical protein
MRIEPSTACGGGGSAVFFVLKTDEFKLEKFVQNC